MGTREGSIELPVFENSDVEQDFLRVQTDSGYGVLALSDPSSADVPFLRVMTSSGVKAIDTTVSSFEFYDGFEASSIDSSWSTEEMVGDVDYEVTDIRSFSGSQCVRIYMDDDQLSNDDENAVLTRNFSQARERKFSVMVYDDGSTAQWVASIGGDGSGMKALEWGQASNYQYRDGDNFYSTGKSRTNGWHKFEFVADGSETRFLIDGEVVHTSTDITIIESVQIGSFWEVNDWGYFDDVEVERL